MVGVYTAAPVGTTPAAFLAIFERNGEAWIHTANVSGSFLLPLQIEVDYPYIVAGSTIPGKAQYIAYENGTWINKGAMENLPPADATGSAFPHDLDTDGGWVVGSYGRSLDSSVPQRLVVRNVGAPPSEPPQEIYSSVRGRTIGVDYTHGDVAIFAD